MMPDRDGQLESTEANPDQLSRLIELELIQKRLAWEKKISRNKQLKTLSILFLFLIIVGSLFAFFMFFTHVTGPRSNQDATPASSSSKP